MPKKPELDEQEVWNYYESHKLTRRGVVDSISKLEKRNWHSPAPDPGEVAENEVEILDLRAKKHILDAKRLAFKAGKQAINPPSKGQLDALRDLIEKVEELNTSGRILEQIVELTTEGLNTFTAIHPGSA